MSTTHTGNGKSTWKGSSIIRQKLIPRLARYFGNETHYGKQQVRKLLQAGGYPGPKWSDEERAVRVLTAAGKPMTAFPRTQNGNGQNGQNNLANTANPQTVALTQSRAANLLSPSRDSPADRLKNATIFLRQGEKIILREIKEGKRTQLDDEVAFSLLAALNEIRR